MPKPARVTPLTTDQVQHLEDFLGYGRLDAPVWFVGMEEGGGGPENIRARLHFRPVEDCADAHRRLKLLQYHRAERPVIQRTWGQMARFMLQLQGSEFSAEHVRAYQAGQLGRTGGDSMLLELMPIPKPSLKHSATYDGLLPQYADGEHCKRVRRRRIEVLRQLLQRRRPQVVVCYGKAYWEDFASLFPKSQFQHVPADETAPEFKVAACHDQTVLLTHHLVSKTMNGRMASLAARLQDMRL